MEIETQEVNAIEVLKKLTEDFRASLTAWKDSEGGTRKVIIDGVESELLYTDSQSVAKYARKYTEVWVTESMLMKQEMKNLWFIDCRGLFIEDKGWASSKYRDWAPARFDNSTIACQYLFDRQVFRGSISFRGATFLEVADFESSEFHAPAKFDSVSFHREINFRKARFHATASFQRLKAIAGTVDFSHAVFHRAPLLHETKLPQGTSFDGADFSLSISSLTQRELEQESLAFRTLKQVASAYRGQQDEADFFALEQKIRRKALLAPHVVWRNDPWKDPRSGLRDLIDVDMLKSFKEWRIRASPVEWILSLLYDWVSSYGRSPGRALSCFLIINIVLTVFYRYNFVFGDCAWPTSSYCVANASSAPFAYANPAIQLTIQNVLNPAGITSDKIIVTLHSPTMIAASIFQSLSSYLVLLLAALAIRTRFQKGSGGGV